MNKIDKMIEKIVKYSHINDSQEIRDRLLNEFVLSGINVLDDFYKFKQNNKIEYFEYNENMDKFYTETDGFLFELAAWHCTYDRLQWKLNILEDIKERFKTRSDLKILMIGDGLGFDSLFLYQNLKNLDITYFEFENSKSFNFAHNMFDDNNALIKRIGSLENIKTNYYDIVICLEVFEHLANPKFVIKNIDTYLNTQGLVYESESFGAVELLRPTHLLSNNQYVGKIINLFEEALFVFVDRIYPRIYIFSKNKKDKASFFKYSIRRIKNIFMHYMFKIKFKNKNIEQLNQEYLKIKNNINLCKSNK